MLDESERGKRISSFGRVLASPEVQDMSGGTRPLVFADHMMDVCNNPSTRLLSHTSRWIGIAGQLVDGYVPSSAEISSILNESTEGFFVYTPESLLSQIPPNVITSLSFLSCRFGCLFDRVHTPGSLLRQGKLEATKTVLEHELEQPISATVLLTLAGCQSTLMPSWTINVAELQSNIEDLFKAMLDENRSLGDSVYLTQMKHMVSRYPGLCETVSQSATQANLNQSIESPLSSADALAGLDWSAFNMLLYGLPAVFF